MPHVGHIARLALEHHDLRVIFIQLGDVGVDLRLAESDGERPVLVGAEVLVGEEQHQVLVQQLLDEGKLGIGYRGQR